MIREELVELVLDAVGSSDPEKVMRQMVASVIGETLVVLVSNELLESRTCAGCAATLLAPISSEIPGITECPACGDNVHGQVFRG